jgi:diadenosine tetraphosphatase ApaH/serine/threonine PP2A family protein phosphatase
MPETSTRIEIIGALAPEQAIDEARILQALSGTAQKLTHGGAFTGRPGTRVFSSDEVVVKLRAELTFSPSDMRRWIERALEKERRLAVHAPQKTWLLLWRGSDAVIANATPRLQPLHTLGHLSGDELLPLLEGVVDHCIRTGARHEFRLDEGLSNFAVDPAGTIYYLDDETYDWDGFTGLTQMLGVWIRQLSALDAQGAQRLGEHLRTRILSEFGDPHAARVLAEGLRSVLALTERQIAARDACVAAIAPPARPRVRPPRSGVFALLADIHANLPALNAVLHALRDRGIRQALVLGDVVGYGPHPAECIERLEQAGLAVLKGNHDHAVASGLFSGGFSSSGRWVVQWTREVLSSQHLQWLDRLPLYLEGEDWLAVHGAPLDRTFFNAYVYNRTYEDNLDNLRQRAIRFCFHGHSHLRGVYFENSRERGFRCDSSIDLEGMRHALICPGSVGQTRRGVGGLAEFAILDTDARQLHLLEVPYDPEITIEQMRVLGFPDSLQQRLRNGQ